MLLFDLGTVHFQKPQFVFQGNVLKAKETNINANVVLFNGSWQEVIKRKHPVTKKKKAGFLYQPNMIFGGKICAEGLQNITAWNCSN